MVPDAAQKVSEAQIVTDAQMVPAVEQNLMTTPPAPKRSKKEKPKGKKKRMHRTKRKRGHKSKETNHQVY